MSLGGHTKRKGRNSDQNCHCFISNKEATLNSDVGCSKTPVQQQIFKLSQEKVTQLSGEGEKKEDKYRISQMLLAL